MGSVLRSWICGIEGRGTQCVNLDCSLLEALGITRGENHLGSLRTRSARRLEANAGTPADHDNGLPQEICLALGGRSDSNSAHGCSGRLSNKRL
jgi:hypothetical protein